NDRLVRLSGVIQSVGDASIVVLGHRVLVTPQTKIVSEFGSPMGFEDLVVGARVRIIASVEVVSDAPSTNTRVFTAVQIVVGDDHWFTVGGKIESLGHQTITVAGLTFQTSTDTEIVTDAGVELQFSDL